MFLCFSSLFSVFLHFSSFFFAFLLFSQRIRETTAIYCKNGEFHSDPVCTDPVQNFPSIYLHRSGPLLDNGLDRPENRYGRYGFASFSGISISTVGWDGARISLSRFSFLAPGVVVDVIKFPVFCPSLTSGRNY